MAGDAVADVVGEVAGDAGAEVAGDAGGDVTGEVAGDVTGEVAGEVGGDVTGEVAGEVGGDVTGEVTGEVAGDVTGEVAGDVTGEVAGEVGGDVAPEVGDEVAGEVVSGDDRGPVEAGAVVAGAGDEGATVALLNGGRCAAMATMRYRTMSETAAAAAASPRRERPGRFLSRPPGVSVPAVAGGRMSPKISVGFWPSGARARGTGGD